MPYDAFSDPEVRASLESTMAEPERQKYGFDARALFELLRRRGAGRLAQGSLNDNAFDTPGAGFYGMDNDGRLFHGSSPDGDRVDPLDPRALQGLYDFEDASPFKRSGMVRSQPAQLSQGDYEWNLANRTPDQTLPANPYPNAFRDVADYEPSPVDPMALHAAKKQRF